MISQILITHMCTHMYKGWSQNGPQAKIWHEFGLIKSPQTDAAA